MKSARQFTITAHTGTMGTADNSLESISAGIKNGADIVEFDLNFNKEGTPVLSHNEPKGGEVLFEDALKFIAENDSEIQINIDVKTTYDLKTVEELVKKYGLINRAFFTGIFEKFIPAVKEQCTDIKYYLNYNKKPPFFGKKKFYAEAVKTIKNSGAVGLNVNFLCLEKAYVDYLHKEGLLVSAWTPNTEKQMQWVMKKGVDNITTEHPDVLRKL